MSAPTPTPPHDPWKCGCELHADYCPFNPESEYYRPPNLLPPMNERHNKIVGYSAILMAFLNRCSDLLLDGANEAQDAFRNLNNAALDEVRDHDTASRELLRIQQVGFMQWMEEKQKENKLSPEEWICETCCTIVPLDELVGRHEGMSHLIDDEESPPLYCGPCLPLDVRELAEELKGLRKQLADVRQKYISKRHVEERNKRRAQDWNDRDIKLLRELLEEEADRLGLGKPT